MIRAVAHADILELCLREQLVTHAAHFKFQSLIKGRSSLENEENIENIFLLEKHKES